MILQLSCSPLDQTCMFRAKMFCSHACTLGRVGVCVVEPVFRVALVAIFLIVFHVCVSVSIWSSVSHRLWHIEMRFSNDLSKFSNVQSFVAEIFMQCFDLHHVVDPFHGFHPLFAGYVTSRVGGVSRLALSGLCQFSVCWGSNFPHSMWWVRVQFLYRVTWRKKSKTNLQFVGES